MRSAQRLMWPDGRFVPRPGDLARVIDDVLLEGGVTLRFDQNVLVEHVVGDGYVVGVKWRDKEGTHIMALPSEKIEVVP